MATEERELAILFGDVAGSTRLYESLGDRAALAAIEGVLRIMSDAVTACGGRVVKTIGDEVMATLPSASTACAAAIAMQRGTDALDAVSGPGGRSKLAVRVGFHLGSVLEEEGDCFGDTVNVAARLVALARGGEIITSGDTAGQLAPEQRSGTRELDRFALKGKAEDMKAVEVLWQESPELTMVVSTRSMDEARPGSFLKLASDRGEWIFDARSRSISLGREAGNDVVIVDTQASRRHATIERRREKWVLIDHSTNGTFVVLSGQAQIDLRREELILQGSGEIRFGHRNAGSGEDCLRFEVR
jgi:class 3 adenylate cyclase